MTIIDAIESRHSVRSYLKKEIPFQIVKQIEDEIKNCNQESGLNIQLILNHEKGFQSFMAHYGHFHDVQNYIALVGNKTDDLDEKIGYYGEKIVLLAQQLGLNTCWVAMTFNKSEIKSQCIIHKNQKLVCVLAIGYGKTQGVAHKSKSISDVCTKDTNMPDWYQKGIECALLAPTAMNQQKFMFSRNDHIVSVKSTGGFYSKVDLGIVKYHFEIGAGMNHFQWK